MYIGHDRIPSVSSFIITRTESGGIRWQQLKRTSSISSHLLTVSHWRGHIKWNNTKCREDEWNRARHSRSVNSPSTWGSSDTPSGRLHEWGPSHPLLLHTGSLRPLGLEIWAHPGVPPEPLNTQEWRHCPSESWRCNRR